MSPNKRAQRRYIARLIALMVVYIGSLFVGLRLVRAGELGEVATIVAAIVPGLAIVGVFWALGRFIVELDDEFIRMLMIRQAMIAAAFALSAAAIHGFLSSFDVVAPIDAFWWPTLFFLGLPIGQVVNRITFGTWGQCA